MGLLSRIWSRISSASTPVSTRARHLADQSLGLLKWIGRDQDLDRFGHGPCKSGRQNLCFAWWIFSLWWWIYGWKLGPGGGQSGNRNDPSAARKSDVWETALHLFAHQQQQGASVATLSHHIMETKECGGGISRILLSRIRMASQEKVQCRVY